MIVLSLYSAFLFALAFPGILDPGGYPVLGWCFAVLFFSALENEPLPRRLAAGLVFGLTGHAFLVDWFISYSLPGFMVFVLGLTLQPVIFAAFYPCSFSRRWVRFLFVPSLWVSAEYFRQLVMGGFSWDLAHSQTGLSWVLPWVNLAGSKGLSFILLAVNWCLYSAATQIQQRRFYMIGLALLVAAVLVYGNGQERKSDSGKSSRSLRVAVIQPNADTKLKLDPGNVARLTADLIVLTREAARQSPDLIIWPETAVPDDLWGNEVLRQALAGAARESGAWLLAGAVLQERGRQFNSAVLFSSAGEIEGVYRKQALVPFTEYLPWERWGIYGWRPGRFSDFQPGKESPVFVVPPRTTTATASRQAVKIGVAICSEDAVSGLFRRYARGGVDLAVVLFNDGWFSDPRALLLHAQNAVVRAVENGLPVVRAGNSGWSCIIDRFGRISPATPPPGKRACAVVTVSSGRSFTFYSVIGDNFSRLCSVFVIMTCLFFFRSKRSFSSLISSRQHKDLI